MSEEPVWFRSNLGFRLRRAWMAVQTDLVKTLEPYKLRMVTYSALAAIVHNKGIRSATLAELINVQRPNLVSLVNELEKLAYIKKSTDPDDGRSTLLEVTSLGAQAFYRASLSVAEHDERLSRTLGEEGKSEMMRSLQVVEQAALDMDLERESRLQKAE